MLKAEDFEFRSEAYATGSSHEPPAGAGWGFVQMGIASPGAKPWVVITWSRPLPETGESVRQRLLAKLVAVVAPVARAASDGLLGVTQAEGKALLDALQADQDLKGIMAPAVMALQQADRPSD